MVIAGVLLVLFEKGLVFKKLGEKCKVWRSEAEANVEKARVEKEQTGEVRVLKELYDLKTQGIITEEEFEKKKKDILDRL
ncbi:MAG: SHOCT domain-containing protein [Clostridia bacterium]|nr:SHOCT domain-containing protein [Clostridia bacterium]